MKAGVNADSSKCSCRNTVEKDKIEYGK